MIETKVINEYKNGKSISFLSKKHDITRYKIRKIISSNNIDIRNHKDSLNLALNKHCLINNEVLEMIDGLMLGDATIENGRLSIRQKEDNKEWVLSISDFFTKNNIENRISNIVSKSHYKKDGSFIRDSKQIQMRTLTYEEIKQQRKRWYQNNKKIIPSDVIINDVSFAMFYCGDGSLYVSPDKNMCQLSLMTDGFDIKDLLFLRDKIKEKYDINFNITKRNSLRKCDKIKIFKLLKNIEDYIPRCFLYKIDMKDMVTI